MVLVDTHCHLDVSYFPNADDVIARAQQAGVFGFVVIGVGADQRPAAAAIELASARASRDVVATAGVHPHDASSYASQAPLLEQHVRHALVVAVGETGLDYHYDHAPRATQHEAFRQQIALARAVQKPLIIHTREAAADTLQILEEESARDVGGIIHCFSEDVAFARRALDLDFDISFSGIVTFKSAHDIHACAAWVPADRYLVETDSPYLAPVPLRGKPCEPAYVVHTARRVAMLRGVSIEQVELETTANAARRLRHAFGGAAGA
jgi:TatD DNase family protein